MRYEFPSRTVRRPLGAPRELLRRRPTATAWLFEQPDGPGGPGRMVERHLGMWYWTTWANDSPGHSRRRCGWSLRLSRALQRSEDALSDYQLFPYGRA